MAHVPSDRPPVGPLIAGVKRAALHIRRVPAGFRVLSEVDHMDRLIWALEGLDRPKWSTQSPPEDGSASLGSA